MNNDNKTSFFKEFLKSLVITLCFQFITYQFACFSIDFFDTSKYCSIILFGGWIISIIINIILAVKNSLNTWKKLCLIILLPTNYTMIIYLYYVTYKLIEFFKFSPI